MRSIITIMIAALANCGPGHVCDAVGQPCSPGTRCGVWLACIQVPGRPADVGVCAEPCSAEHDCSIGSCDEQAGMCRDVDGLPVGLCPGLPLCVGEPCEGECAEGLACLYGSCALPCEADADCQAGQVCKLGACWVGDTLAGNC